MATLFIVHHVDTEGPLYEPIQETFSRIEYIFNIKLNLPPTKQNLVKLQNGEIKLEKNISEGIKKNFSPHFLSYKKNWEEIDEMLSRILSASFRQKFTDSFGNNWIYNWHIMDHVGFLTNERFRDIGYLRVFNHYESIFNSIPSPMDEIHWHFHPISAFKDAHISATSYENSIFELHQSICRRLIEKKIFPRVNRPGFHTIRPDSNWFLEQWIPFDASNQSVLENIPEQADAVYGRGGDWAGAPNNWSIYQPDLYDWRKKGRLKRNISRVLNLNARFRSITETEIEKAFIEAQNKNVYLGVTNHDFREMSCEIEDFYNKLINISQKYNNVKYEFSGAINAFRNVLYYSKEEIKSNKLDFDALFINKNTLMIRKINGHFFGSQPYLAIKTKNDFYYHDNFDFGEFDETYYYTFDKQTVPLDNIKKIMIAANDKYANTCIIEIVGDQINKIQYD